MRFARPTDLPARLAVLAAVLAPMLIWLLGKGRLLHPAPAAIAALYLALLLATAPGRGLRAATCALLLLLPSTLAWLATVAVTGVGPSLASAQSLTQGAYREVLDAAGLAIRTPAFIAVALATLAAVVLAWRLTRRRAGGAGMGSTITNALFLAALLPLLMLKLGVPGMRQAAAWFGPETQISTPLLFQLDAARTLLSEGLDAIVLAGEHTQRPLRDASKAQAGFRAEPGVAVFIVGESLRADALLKPGRGPASDQLAARLAAGLGVHLPDACAGGNSTFFSVPKLLTLATDPNPALAEGQPTLLATARGAGARTAYINNHEIWVVSEHGHDWLQKLSSSYFAASDEQAYAAAEDFVQRTAAPTRAVLLHLYGQHFAYQERYPADLFPGEPAGLDGTGLEELRYQRAAEFGTRLLLRMAKFMDSLNEPAYLVFTSDHGENLLSDGHGRQFHAGPFNGRADTIVPVLVLWNRAFANSGRAARLETLRRAPAPLAHRDVAQAWLHLLGDPQPLLATPAPQTWGAARPGEAVGPLPCAALGP
jgi:glucan phosphoethanolaminetransferase (alkaline phosphatase superfamily)